jgi:hypothetical protein
MGATVGQPERATQNRSIALFRNKLRYRYLRDWADRDGTGTIRNQATVNAAAFSTLRRTTCFRQRQLQQIPFPTDNCSV